MLIGEGTLNLQSAGGRLVYTDFRIRENLTVRDTATGRQVWTKNIGRSDNRGSVVHEGPAILADRERTRAYNDGSGDLQRWYPAPGGRRLVALHAKKVTALPVG